MCYFSDAQEHKLHIIKATIACVNAWENVAKPQMAPKILDAIAVQLQSTDADLAGLLEYAVQRFNW